MAIISEYMAADATAWKMVTSDPRTSGCEKAATIVQTFGMAVSPVSNGKETTLPSHFTASHMSTVSKAPAVAHPTEIAPRLTRRQAVAIPGDLLTKVSLLLTCCY